MVRSKIKGSNTTLEDKIKAVNAYFGEERTKDAYERVLNYLEGLQLGYKGKNEDAVDTIETEIIKYRAINNANLPKETNGFINFEDATRYSFDERYNLWRDLFLRNEKWLQKGYFQKEINDFMDVLNKIFVKNEEKLKDRYSFERLEGLRKEAKEKENTHKFFF